MSASYIHVPNIPEGYKQTTPVEPEKRLPGSDIRIDELGDSEADAKLIVRTISHITSPSLPHPIL